MHNPVEFESGGIKLRGDFFSSENPKQAVLFLHGWTAKPKNHAAEALANNGYAAMTYSYPGHNNSEGDIKNLTRQQTLRSAIDAYDLLVSMIPKGTKVAVAGSSYGGYLAPLLSNERELNGISMRVPANYPDEGFDEPQFGKGHKDPEIMKWRRQPHNHTVTKSLSALNEYQGNVQIIEAGLDDLVPHETVQSYVDAVNDPFNLDYHLMKDWPHSMGDDVKRNKEFNKLLLDWLNKL